ncbi:MAG: hypothetical protein LKK00_09255 [Intestinimonas sp.]|jgi:hypothetical protein|nr:hypothetical protein [Intestinimonas sp.]
MTRRIRYAAAGLAAALLFCLSLSGCGDKMTTFDATAYIQGLLDETYKGTWSAGYLALVGLSKTEAVQAYADGLDQEYARFVYQLGLNDALLSDQTRSDAKELLKDICLKAQYTVHDAVPLDDTRYAVDVSVRPIDLFEQVESDDLNDYTDTFLSQYTGVTDQTARAEAWAQGMISLCRNKLNILGYGDVEHILMLVSPDDSGHYSISDNDFSNLCALVLPY